MFLFVLRFLASPLMLVSSCSSNPVNSEFAQPTVAWYQRSTNGSSLESNPLDVILRSELPESDDNDTFSESVGEESSSTSLSTFSRMSISITRLPSPAAAIDSRTVTSFPRESIENRVFFLNDKNEWANVFAHLQSPFSVPNFLKRSAIDWKRNERHARTFAPLMANATFKLPLTPPTSWTYCEPLCGVDDQAIDAESAFENAQEDIREAVIAAFKRENVALNDAHRITVVYEMNSTLLEEFGDFFGFDGARYHAEDGVVVGKTDTTHPRSTTPYFITIEVKVASNFAISNIFWRRIANDVLLYLREHKKTRFHDIIAVVF